MVGGGFLDGRRQTGQVHHLGEIMFHHGAGAGFFYALVELLAGFLVPHFLDQFFHVDHRVPHVQGPHVTKLRHVLPVGTHTRQGRITSNIFAERVVPAGENEARGQAFDVPFPGSRQRLVQVIDVEDHAAFRGGEAAEVK
jgi:hypothetical protein